MTEDNKLNTQELIIVNPKYRDANTILKIGDSLNVTILNPLLNIVEDVHKVEDVETDYEREVAYDTSKYASYSEVTQEGVNGLSRLTEE